MVRGRGAVTGHVPDLVNPTLGDTVLNKLAMLISHLRDPGTLMRHGRAWRDAAKVSLDSCILSGNLVGVSVYADVAISNSTIADNTFTGVLVSSGGARLTRNMITRNGTGISVLGGSAYSTGDNLVDGNTINSSGTISPATKM